MKRPTPLTSRLLDTHYRDAVAAAAPESEMMIIGFTQRVATRDPYIELPLSECECE